MGYKEANWLLHEYKSQPHCLKFTLKLVYEKSVAQQWVVQFYKPEFHVLSLIKTVKEIGLIHILYCTAEIQKILSKGKLIPTHEILEYWGTLYINYADLSGKT